MMFGLPDRVPFRLRVFFRGAFALLAFATVALALTVLVDEKQRSHRRYAEGLHKNLAQIAARLRHPTGQLALLNPELADQAPTPLHPLVLPFAAIDFDDRVKSLQAIEMAGCQVQYPDGSGWCAGVGNNPYAGAFVYLVGSVALGELVSHPSGERDLTGFHRVRVELAMRGQTFRWIAPFEALDDGANSGANGSAGRRGRLTGYIDENQPIAPGTRPVRDFRGWLWQEGRCIERDADPAVCVKRSFVSIRLPIEIFRDDLFQKKLVWPPADLAQMRVRLQLFAPGDGPALFDTSSDGATVPFSLGELRALLTSGEHLSVHKLAAGAGAAAPAELLTLNGAADTGEPVSPWLAQLIRQLPVDGFDVPVVARDTIATPLGRYELVLTGDVRSVNRGLATVATRLSWFVGAMLLAIALTWLAIELRIIRRITLLTRRAASVSIGVRGSDGVAGIDLADLRGSDELGVLAQGLRDLLRRVNDDVRREQIRAEQEKDMWHAVGHEIMSPLQSLMALHGSADDASHRYVSRMQQAVKVLYGHASPSEALQSTTLQLAPIDLNEFLGNVARNAPYTGIEHVVFRSLGRGVAVRAEEYALEDVVTHVLRNADRYRSAGSPICIELDDSGSDARVHIHNDGPPIPPALIDAIFEYGVSDPAQAGAPDHRGQGLFVAKTYMAKMGGTITVANVDEHIGRGVRFTLSLPKPLPS